MGFSTNYGALCATRFLLGLFEGKLRGFEFSKVMLTSAQQPPFSRSFPSSPVNGIGDLSSPFVLPCG